MPRDPHPLSARFFENSVFFKKRTEPPGKKTGSTEEGATDGKKNYGYVWNS